MSNEEVRALDGGKRTGNGQKRLTSLKLCISHDPNAITVCVHAFGDVRAVTDLNSMDDVLLAEGD